MRLQQLSEVVLHVKFSPRIGQYRDKQAKSGRSMVHYGRYVVATSRAAAEAYAFE